MPFLIPRRLAGVVLVACACGCVAPRSVPKSSVQSIADRQSASAGTQSNNRLITSSSMGLVRLNLKLEAIRKMLPRATFERASDGDGAALISVTLGPDDELVLWAGEDDPDAPIDWSREVITIFTFSKTFHTSEGIRPGARVSDVIQIFGPVEEAVVSEIESREYVTFERQPSWLTFRMNDQGILPAGARRSKTVRPDATILGIYISSH
jgi:hypothetical protein